jgi:hypothetical protein
MVRKIHKKRHPSAVRVKWSTRRNASELERRANLPSVSGPAQRVHGTYKMTTTDRPERRERVQHGSWGQPAMSSRMAGEYGRVSRGGLAPGARRPGFSGGGVVSSSGRLECNWWGVNGQQATTPRRQQRSGGASRPPPRVPTGKGNRELVRRALSPPAACGVLRRWSFRPTPSRLRNASSSAPCLATTAAVMVSS